VLFRFFPERTFGTNPKELVTTNGNSHLRPPYLLVTQSKGGVLQTSTTEGASQLPDSEGHSTYVIVGYKTLDFLLPISQVSLLRDPIRPLIELLIIFKELLAFYSPARDFEFSRKPTYKQHCYKITPPLYPLCLILLHHI
jgi:hypothetical protein